MATWQYDFQAKVTFCQPMAEVKFDYQDQSGALCQMQQHVFTTYADPFSQNTAVGGLGSLSVCGGRGGGGAWHFLVTATDQAKQTTTLSVPFTLVVSNK
jgi:hypothetical protein